VQIGGNIAMVRYDGAFGWDAVRKQFQIVGLRFAWGATRKDIGREVANSGSSSRSGRRRLARPHPRRPFMFPVDDETVIWSSFQSNCRWRTCARISRRSRSSDVRPLQPNDPRFSMECDGYRNQPI